MPVGDAVGAVDLLEPAEAQERGDRFVDPFAGGADHAGQLLLGHGQLELVAVTRQVQEPLGGPPGDVEEHGVGQRTVGDADATGQEGHDRPQQAGILLEDAPDRGVGHDHDRRGLQGPGRGGTTVTVEEGHLAEEVAALHEGHHRLPAVHGHVGDGDAAVEHDEELRRLVLLTEEDVVAVQNALLRGPGDLGQRLRGELGEELDVGEQLGVDHGPKASDMGHRPGPAGTVRRVWTAARRRRDVRRELGLGHRGGGGLGHPLRAGQAVRVAR